MRREGAQGLQGTGGGLAPLGEGPHPHPQLSGTVYAPLSSDSVGSSMAGGPCLLYLGPRAVLRVSNSRNASGTLHAIWL